MKVLFIHGINGEPNSKKAEYLKEIDGTIAGIKVYVEDNFTSTWNPMKKNWLFWNADYLHLVLILEVFVFLFLLDYVPTVLLIVECIGFCYLLYKVRYFFFRDMLWNTYRACKKIQRKAIQDLQPDLIVASSWGCEILVPLLFKKEYTGHVLLLSPVNGLLKRHDYPLIRCVLDSRLIIVSDVNDSLAPEETQKIMEKLKKGYTYTYHYRSDYGGHSLPTLLSDDSDLTLRKLVIDFSKKIK